MEKVWVELDALKLGNLLLILCICDGLHLENFDESYLEQFFLRNSHIFQKVIILQGFGPFILPGPLPHTCSANFGEYDKKYTCLSSLV